MALKQKMASMGSWYVGQNRNIFFERDFQNYSQKAAEKVVSALREALQRKKSVVFVSSAGKSPKKMYEILQQTYRDKIDWSRVIVFQMDEYWNMPCNDEKSMALSIEQELIHPLGIKNYLHFFDSHGKLIHTLDRYERLVEEMGGIDVIVHGIGRNGHIGFNEPGSNWSSPTRKVSLADSTLEANFNSDDSNIRTKYRMGVTLGLHLLTKAKHAILLLSGESKNAIVEKFFSENPSQAIPASSVSLNPKVDCIIDGKSISFFRQITSHQ